MAENLRTEYTTDGTPLENVFAFANQQAHVAGCGRLDAYEAAMRAAPPGWHLPSDEAWSLLEVALGARWVQQSEPRANQGLMRLMSTTEVALAPSRVWIDGAATGHRRCF